MLAQGEREKERKKERDRNIVFLIIRSHFRETNIINQ